MEIKAVNQDKEAQAIERKRKIAESAKKIMTKYDVTLRKLAK